MNEHEKEEIKQGLKELFSNEQVPSIMMDGGSLEYSTENFVIYIPAICVTKADLDNQLTEDKP